MWIAIVACIVLFFVPLIFVWNDVYEDGIVGRLALIGISGSAAIWGLKILQRGYAWPESVMLLVSFAVFLCWHLVRFHRRVLRNEKAKRHEIERRTAFGGPHG